MNLWTESEIIENEGKRYLNREATKRFLEAYKDSIKISLAPDADPDDVLLISYDYATKVVKKYPIDNKVESNFNNRTFSLQDFLNNGQLSVNDFESNQGDKQLPIVVPQEEFITEDSESLYTPEELKVIEYFKKEGKVNLLKIPHILKGCGFSVDKLIEYGRLLSRALPWYTFTSSDERELIDKLNKNRIERFSLKTLISVSKSLDEIIDVLKEYKKFGKGDCSESDLIDAILDFLSNHPLISDEEVKRFWDNLSDNDVFEGSYLKSYFSQIQPFSSVIAPNVNDSDVIDIDLSGINGDVYTLDDLLDDINHPTIYEDVKKYIENYLAIHSNKVDLKVGKIEWLKQFINLIYSEFEIEDNNVLLNTLSQCLADREPLNISASDIQEAFNRFKTELENSTDDDIKDEISKCISFGNTYYELLKIYENSNIDKWSKYDGYVAMYIKEKVEYSTEIESKNAYLRYINELGMLLLDIKQLSDTQKTDTFKTLASNLNMTTDELYSLAENYNIGIGDPIKDFGLKDDELQKDSEDSFTIKKRRKPKTKHEIKKIIFTTLAGAGIISCLYLTFVLKRNPITVIKNCTATFRALFSGNSSLAALGASLGNLTAYFGSAIVAIGSGLKLGKIISSEDDEPYVDLDSELDEFTNKPITDDNIDLDSELDEFTNKPSTDDNIDLDTELDEINNNPSTDDNIDLDTELDEFNNNPSTDDDVVDLTDMDLSGFMEDDNSFYGKRR